MYKTTVNADKGDQRQPPGTTPRFSPIPESRLLQDAESQATASPIGTHPFPERRPAGLELSSAALPGQHGHWGPGHRVCAGKRPGTSWGCPAGGEDGTELLGAAGWGRLRAPSECGEETATATTLQSGRERSRGAA